MMKNPSRKGSALLVVLGMLAFMVVSAVAFSAYMRYSRLPSSYLRRTTASRELVKAALARAIDEIDQAVGENPHPGFGVKYYEDDGDSLYVDGNGLYKFSESSTKTKNYWYNHVYIGTNHLQSAFANTAPVMTLEGLAYIPPPYVDAARYYGRLSSAGCWKTFDFDAGRYAFCAIDVSDMLDVNRLSASLPRNSAGSGRISLSYLLEGSAHSSAASAGSNWDDLIAKFRTEEEDGSFSYEDNIPLVSLGDLNMAIGESTYGGLFSPWYKYVKSGSGEGFYCGKEDYARMMPFVTDSYFPTTNTASNTTGDYDLANPEFQPFEPSELVKEGQLPAKALQASSLGAKRLLESMCGIGLCSLWDYLDTDSIPMSLALPTIERNPMVVAIQPDLDSSGTLKIVEKREEPETVNEGNTIVNTQTITYTIDGTSLASALKGVKTLVAYPFIRDDGQQKGSWTAEGYLSLFFTSGTMKSRTGSSKDVIHYGAIKGAKGVSANSVIVVPFDNEKSLSFSSVNSEDDAISSADFTLLKSRSDITSALKNNPILTLKIKWIQTKDPDTGAVTPDSAVLDGTGDVEILEAKSSLLPLNADGTVLKESDAIGAIQGGSFTDGITVDLNVAVNVAVKNKDGTYVDLAPACFDDDKDLNGKNTSSYFGPMKNKISAPYPVLKMTTGASLDLTVKSLAEKAADSSGLPISLSPAAIQIDDPTYNHEPESWYGVDSISASDWLSSVKSNYKINDIFMNTSDQGYMQSVYELAFLPRLTDLSSSGADQILGDYDQTGGRTSFETDRTKVANYDLMWRTYAPFANDEFSLSADDFEGVGFTSGSSGYHISPFTTDLSVMMAAFANTPLDWAAAGTNLNSAVKKDGSFPDDDVVSFNKNYAWNEYNSKAKIEYSKLEELADAFMGSLASSSGTDNGQRLSPGASLPYRQDVTFDWRSAWADLWKDDKDEKTLAGVDVSSGSSIYDIDRKFLYGYWKECFAARQHLFLIFVRAEPMMMGGGSLSKIPPQLGARAVALVWRDPTPYDAANANNSSGKGAPHRTRILFYKTLE